MFDFTFVSRNSHFRRHLLLGAAGLAALGPARAQKPEPTPVRLLVGFPAGGTIDVPARNLARFASPALGEPIEVRHLAGSSGRVALDALGKGPTDGSLLALGTGSMLTLAPNLWKSDWPDPQRDLVPVAMVASFSFAMNLRPDLPVTDLASFVAWAREQAAAGRAVHFASHGPGTVSHYCGTLLDRTFGLKLTHLPYRGGPPARIALESGQAQLLFDTVGDSLDAHRTRRARVIATTGADRSPFLPGVPTLIEQRVAHPSIDGWLAVIAPAGTSAARVARLSAAFRAAAATPEFIADVDAAGFVPEPAGPERVAARIADDLGRWARAIRALRFDPTA